MEAKSLLILTLLLLISSPLHAAVVYTDVTPDRHVYAEVQFDDIQGTYWDGNGDEFNIDLDGDGVLDLWLCHTYPFFSAGGNPQWGDGQTQLGGLNGARCAATSDSEWAAPTLFGYGDVIGPACSFPDPPMLEPFFHGSFPDNHYLGVRFDIGGQTHYGWACMSSGYNESVIVHGYAYESEPGQPIATPEPATLSLMILGFGVLAIRRRKRH